MSPNEVREYILPYIPSLVSMAGLIALIYAANYLIRLRYERQVIRDHLQQQLLQAVLFSLGAIGLILAAPISEVMKGQLLTLSGILGSAVIGLSSTTFVGNALAGVMLSALGHFKSGDYLKIGEHFGRISDRGLFHTEIQTTDRRLTTLPNLYLVTNPIEVVPASGTVVSATCSLGYDISRTKIEAALRQAGARAGLDEAFVQIRELGDYSVTYRVAGVLGDIRQLITSHSRLRAAMLDCLHEEGIEIVSPAFENQRAWSSSHNFIPCPTDFEELPKLGAMEDVVFDKADLAVSIERLQEKLTALEDESQALRNKMTVEANPEVIEQLEAQIVRKEELIEVCKRTIQAREDKRSGL